MASMSLPRVLQPRKTSFELERENFEKCQAIAITKAINNLESPVKQKHVRSTIIGTFHDKSAKTFWLVVLKLPLLEDRIVAWKFCHVLHKLLREGHPSSVTESYRHRDQLENLGKLWVHLQDCYGKLINLYSGLLLSKLEFHHRNPRFPGNLILTRSELENIGENDVNIYFQMCVEMFEYMDAVLELQSAIFGSINRSRSNSMMSSGQCRLSPLIPCIQDASRLYDFCVQILFKLHLVLHPDTLAGHRQRFLKQFRELKQFYENTNMLQYFKNLITVPSLPEVPPNFLKQAELHTYVSPVVIVPQEETDVDSSITEGSLIDTAEEADNGSSDAHLTTLIAERDDLILHLQRENKALSMEMQNMASEHRKALNGVHQQLDVLQTDLATCESELVQERQLREDLLHEVSFLRPQDAEQKTKQEKFDKLKDVYTNLREKHIVLIRQSAELEKKMQSITKVNSDLECRVQEDEKKIKELLDQQSQESNKTRTSLDSKEKELAEVQEHILKLTLENTGLSDNVKELQSRVNSLGAKQDETLAREDKLRKSNADLEVTIADLRESILKAGLQRENEIEELVRLCTLESEAAVKRAIDEMDDPASSAAKTCTPEHLCSLTNTARGVLQEIATSNTEPSNRCILVSRLGHILSLYLDRGHATSNSSPDITFADQMTEKCKQLGLQVLKVMQAMRENHDISTPINDSIDTLNAVNGLAETLSKNLQRNSIDMLAELVENELVAMDKSIEEAAKLIQEMLNNSRAADSGIKLEVNEKILDACTHLMKAIKVLVRKSRDLQNEIVSQGKGSASVKEFYKRNHRWTDGLISAAKAVGSAAAFLLNAADEVVNGKGKLEQLIAAAHEIAASTAQLVVSSRVKADRNSENMTQLSLASREVTNATGQIVAAVKNCSEIMDETDNFDATKLTLHMAKRLEMDTQVKILEMEKELDQHRYKLSALRRQHYKLAGENAGWE